MITTVSEGLRAYKATLLRYKQWSDREMEKVEKGKGTHQSAEERAQPVRIQGMEEVLGLTHMEVRYYHTEVGLSFDATVEDIDLFTADRIVGHDLVESRDGGILRRGPISGIQVKNNVVIFSLAWAAQSRDRGKTWRPCDPKAAEIQIDPKETWISLPVTHQVIIATPAIHLMVLHSGDSLVKPAA